MKKLIATISFIMFVIEMCNNGLTNTTIIFVIICYSNMILDAIENKK